MQVIVSYSHYRLMRWDVPLINLFIVHIGILRQKHEKTGLISHSQLLAWRWEGRGLKLSSASHICPSTPAPLRMWGSVTAGMGCFGSSNLRSCYFE